MEYLVSLYHFFVENPLAWQLPSALLATTGAFEFFKRKLQLQGKARITSYLTIISGLSVFVHMLSVGAGLDLTLFGQQTIAYVGALNLVYNFLTTKLTRLLLDAKAAAADSNETPAQINHETPQPAVPSAVAAGVAQF